MAGTTGLEPATSAVTGQYSGVTYRKIGVTDGSFWRSKARMVIVIVPLLCPRPLPQRPLPIGDSAGDSDLDCYRKPRGGSGFAWPQNEMGNCPSNRLLRVGDLLLGQLLTHQP